MHDPITLIGCAVGIIGCIVGVATFVVASLTRAQENGKLMAKVDYLVVGFDEMKQDTKSHNLAIEKTFDEHTRSITDLNARVKNLEKEVFHDSR